ncbi:plastocyanin/azurin family copper-binding protein [Halobaculum limi]|uniref:plastocyanin/azurin family copper-binding protein n=1 Tax=Halobaculum limi TaxID=3031916 RepID=UPI0024063C8A|nr:plastocyanin/azurin family copper-binding protein [Halobaculum sp. YSMS11]
MTSTTERPLSRRTFIRGTAATTGAAVAAGRATGQETGTETGGGEQVIDMTDELVFEPDAVTITPGTTVVWENVGEIGHSVTAYADQIPEGATYFASGDFSDEQSARQEYPEGDIPGGESYSYTFETEGEYEYFCVPHETVGMVASLTVSSEAQGQAETPAGPSVPESALTLGVATATTFAAIVAFVYFFLKYGGDYEGE